MTETEKRTIIDSNQHLIAAAANFRPAFSLCLGVALGSHDNAQLQNLAGVADRWRDQLRGYMDLFESAELVEQLDEKIIALHDYYAGTATDIRAALNRTLNDHNEGEEWKNETG